MAQNELKKDRKKCPPAGNAQRRKVFKRKKKVEMHCHAEFAPARTADNISVGETLAWGRYGIWRFRVIRSHCSFFACVGLPTWHPLAWFHYYRIDLDPHGGFTFDGFLDPDHKKIKWYGWDYAHLWDRLVLGPEEMKELKKSPGWPERFPSFTVDGHNWTMGEVLEETGEILTAFRTRTWTLLIKAILNVMETILDAIADYFIQLRRQTKKILKRKKPSEGSMKR